MKDDILGDFDRGKHENNSNVPLYPNRSGLWLGFWLAWGMVFRGTIAWLLPAGFDETYYYLYVHYLNWSYFDHPLLVAITTGFGPWITGVINPFTIRLGTVVLYTITLYFLCQTGKRLFSAQVGIMTVVITTLIPFFQVGFGILTLPDSPLMFFWALSLWIATWEFFRSEVYRPSSRIILLGLTVGLACLGKYHGFLLGMGLVIFCLVSPRHRQALWSAWTVLGLIVFLTTIGPMLWWNWQYDWVSFKFQSARAIPDRGFNVLDLLVTFLIGNAYLFPSFGFVLWWVNIQELVKEIRSGATHLSALQERHRFILAVAVPVFLGFTLMGSYRQILPSWPMPGFFTSTLLLGERIVNWQENYPKRIRNWLWSSGAIILCLITVALFHTSFGIFQKGGSNSIAGGFWEVKNDPSTQLIDVIQLRKPFQNDPELIKQITEVDFIFCNNFFLGGQVGMALADYVKPPITTFDRDLRGFAFWENDQDWLGKDALYITSDLFKEELTKYDGYFNRLSLIKEIPILRGGQTVQKFFVYRAEKLLKTYPRPYGIGADLPID